MKDICLTCELIKSGGIFTDGMCSKHPIKDKQPFFKGYKSTNFFKVDNQLKGDI